MFGRLINGQDAEVGTILLGEMRVGERKQRVMATPVSLNDEPHCLIVPATGIAFAPSSAWIRQPMWDVTAEVQVTVDPQHFSISTDAPQHGEIGWSNGDWLIAAATSEHNKERAEWVNISSGVPVQHRGDAMLRFPAWRLIMRVADPGPITVFQPAGPPVEPRIRALG